MLQVSGCWIQVASNLKPATCILYCVSCNLYQVTNAYFSVETINFAASKDNFFGYYS